MLFDKLYKIVEETVNYFSHNPKNKNKDIHSFLIRNQSIRDILEIEMPDIENISEILEVSNGKVFAVRMDKTYGITGFKKPIIASLILKRIIESVKRNEYCKNWIDAGNVNSALALAYFANKLDGKAIFIMSRFFPDYVLDYIKAISNNSIHLIKAPNMALGIERDFYKYLVDLMRKEYRFQGFQPLWHAKYSGEYTQFLGEELAAGLNFKPDYIVTLVGAGSTIEGQAIPIKSKFNNSPRIVVPEHIQSPLLHLNQSPINILNQDNRENEYSLDWFKEPPKGIPHSVIGSHYDEINPLIKKEVLESIEKVYRFDEESWKQMSYKCFKNGLKVGNSSAANLVVAKHLADKGNIVLTFIYEPFRTIYRGSSISQNENGTESKRFNRKYTNVSLHHFSLSK